VGKQRVTVVVDDQQQGRRASIAACHSERSCVAFGSSWMNSTASASVLRSRPSGSSIGSSKICSQLNAQSMAETILDRLANLAKRIRRAGRS
jgi:hypothetical protein